MVSPLKIGIITDGGMLSKYDAALVEWAMSQPYLSVSHLIIQSVPAQPVQSRMEKAWSIFTQKGLHALAKMLLWNVIARVELRKLYRYERFRDHLQLYDFTSKIRGHITVIPVVSPSGLVHRFDKDDIAAIRKESFDVLLRCGNGILKGDILQAARFGILSFHHADNRINRGGPAGFWEVYYRQNKTGFVIQQLTEELDGGNVLVRGWYATQPYAMLNSAHILEKSNDAMKRLLLQISNTGMLPPAEEKLPYSQRLFVYPSAYECLAYMAKLASTLVQERIAHKRRLQDRWHVAYQRCNWRHASLWRGNTIPNPEGRFLADPFVIEKNGKQYAFVEDYIYATERGHISVYELTDDGAIPLGVAVKEPFHLSFPYVFTYKNDLYMCPESYLNRDIRIYKCIEFPLKWELASVAMNEINAVDTLIFSHDGLWWMLTNISHCEPLDFCELHVFWTNDPLSGNWTSHLQNPVLIDPDTARNGGLLFDKNDVIRVAQMQGFGSYGNASILRHITHLDKSRYSETTLCDVIPAFKADICGTHHLHSNGTISVWDYKTREHMS